ncbi:class I SAM-dependent methyltransferase [candidate division WWE3 bacterium]|nr:class I SAM-dependent methyltransferase [candidate division WWE3 bacterium]
MIKKLNHCRCCGSKNCKTLFTKYGYDVAKCGECSLVFLNFDPADSFFVDYYSKDFFNDRGTKHAYSDYEKESNSLNRAFAERINTLRKYHGGGTLLDIGCATGTFMKAARASWKVKGVDVSEYAVLQAKKKDLDVFSGELEGSPYTNQKFDIVTLWDTIEHLGDPRKTLRQISKITTPGSVIALTTGDVESTTSRLCGKLWHLYNIPQHLTFFGKGTITKLLGEEGFEVKEISYPPMYLTLDYLLFRLITFYKLAFAFPIYENLKKRGALNPTTKINLHDIVLVVAVKT